MKLFVTLLFVLSLIVCVSAQETIDLRFTNEVVDLDNMLFHVDVQCQRSSVGWAKLGTSNFPVYFNTAGLDNPRLETALNFSGFIPPSSFYVAMTVTDNVDWFYINIELSTTDNGQDVPVTWIDIARIEFDILDAGETSGLVPRVDAAWFVFADDESTQLTPGSMSGLDVSLPVSLSSFRSYIEDSKVVLQWATESEVDNTGFEIWKTEDETKGYALLTSYKENPDMCGQGNSSEKHVYKIKDAYVWAGHTYFYKLADVDVNGNKTFHGPISITIPTDQNIGEPKEEIRVPVTYNLYQNSPNPFNPSTVIRFDIAETVESVEFVDLKIYDVLGKEVRTLYSGFLQSGSHQVEWDGASNAGIKVPSGIYFYRLLSDNFTNIRKMVMMK